MRFELIIRPEAEEEMTEAFDWYEERVSGLGSAFLLNVDGDEPDCDCHRVTVRVFCDTGPDKFLATISYGWKDEQFYENFLGGGDFFLKQESFKGPYLDPLHPQSQYSQRLLSIFKGMVKDKEYEARLERHYLMFKEAVSRK